MPTSVPKIRARVPESNLPHRRAGSATREARFTISFARSFLGKLAASKPTESAVCVRQIAVNGHGIADLVVISWKTRRVPPRGYDPQVFLELAKPQLRAFEVKLSNWRRGMAQAHRYRYFANVSILVLPIRLCAPALPYLETFRRIHVGLWGFDPGTGRIVAHYTPRGTKPLVPRNRLQALKQVARATRSLPVDGRV